jgi:beta-phosphoglucomutase-like phosphatase (HAD superfamily)
MHQLSDFEVCVFDCDGVLIDSNAMKLKAMKKSLIVAGFDKPGVDRGIEIFVRMFGLPRGEIIEKIVHDNHSEFSVNKSNCDDLKGAVDTLYAEIVEREYYDCDLVNCVREFLDKINVPCFVASGTSTTQLKKILHAKGLLHYFQNVYGSPDKKNKILYDIRKAFEHKSKFLMIGDAKTDYEAACENGYHFVGVTKYSIDNERLRKLPNSSSCQIVNSLKDII